MLSAFIAALIQLPLESQNNLALPLVRKLKAAVTRGSAVHHRAEEQTMARRVALFAFCQSLGWDLIQKQPFLDGLAENRSRVRPILGNSCATLPTVLSGKLPSEHGHFAWFVYSPQTSLFRVCRLLSHLPAAVRRSRRFRSAVERSVISSGHITGRLSTFNVPLKHLPLFDFVERRDLFEPGALGEVKTLVDFFEEAGIKYYCSSHHRTDPENADALAEELYEGEITAAFIHLTGIGHAAGTQGPRSSSLRGRMAWADHRIRRLYETATMNYDRVDVIVFSDSGMVEVTATSDLQQEIKHSGYAYGRDYVAVYEQTMARFWFLTDECREGVGQLLNTLPCGKILSDEEMSALGCRFHDNRFGEVIFLADAGTVFDPNYMSASVPVMAPGYSPEIEQLDGMFVCNRADIEPPKNLTEVCGCLIQAAAEAAGVEVAPAQQQHVAAVENRATPD